MTSRKRLLNVLAENVAALRAEKDMSQPEVAAAAKRAGLEVGQTTVGRVERATHAADVETIEAIAKGLSVAPWALLVEDLKPDVLPQLGASALSQDEQQLLDDYRAASDTWKLVVRLVARTTPEEQPQLSREMNVLLTTASRVLHEPSAPYERK